MAVFDHPRLSDQRQPLLELSKRVLVAEALIFTNRRAKVKPRNSGTLTRKPLRLFPQNSLVAPCFFHFGSAGTALHSSHLFPGPMTVAWERLLGHREKNCENGSFIQLALDGDHAVTTPDDAVAHGQTQT